MLLLVYFTALANVSILYIITITTQIIYQRLWLIAFFLADISGQANYILIIMVAKEMYKHYKTTVNRRSRMEEAVKDDILSRIIMLEKEVD